MNLMSICKKTLVLVASGAVIGAVSADEVKINTAVAVSETIDFVVSSYRSENFVKAYSLGENTTRYVKNQGVGAGHFAARLVSVNKGTGVSTISCGRGGGYSNGESEPLMAVSQLQTQEWGKISFEGTAGSSSTPSSMFDHVLGNGKKFYGLMPISSAASIISYSSCVAIESVIQKVQVDNDNIRKMDANSSTFGVRVKLTMIPRGSLVKDGGYFNLTDSAPEVRYEFSIVSLGK